jgi:hypothetical protein
MSTGNERRDDYQDTRWHRGEFQEALPAGQGSTAALCRSERGDSRLFCQLGSRLFRAFLAGQASGFGLPGHGPGPSATKLCLARLVRPLAYIMCLFRRSPSSLLFQFDSQMTGWDLFLIESVWLHERLAVHRLNGLAGSPGIPASRILPSSACPCACHLVQWSCVSVRHSQAVE